MGKGGGGGGGGTQNVVQSNLPEYARPYFEDIMKRGQAESYREYTPYEGQRIAGFTPGQTAAQQATMNLQTPGAINQGSAAAQQATQASMNAGQYTPGQFNAQTVNAQQLTQPEMFGTQQAQQYMSPYVQNVLDVQKAQALRDAQQAQLAQNLGAARQGTYGGARQLIATTERERNLADQMANIQAKGLQSAFENAQQQFERDRAAKLGVQQLGSQQGLQAALANQQANLDAQRAAEQSRQFGTTSRLQGLSQALQGAQTLGQLGTQQQAADLQRIQAQAAAGAEQRALQQQYLDTAYADFLRQRDYPMEQLGYFSNLMRGMPVGLGSTQTTYAPPPSLASQIGGLGLAGLGMYNLTK